MYDYIYNTLYKHFLKTSKVMYTSLAKDNPPQQARGTADKAKCLFKAQRLVNNMILSQMINISMQEP